MAATNLTKVHIFDDKLNEYLDSLLDHINLTKVHYLTSARLFRVASMTSRRKMDENNHILRCHRLSDHFRQLKLQRDKMAVGMPHASGYIVKHFTTGKRYALKEVCISRNKEEQSNSLMKSLISDQDSLFILKSPFIVEIIATWIEWGSREDIADKFCIVSEICRTDLFELLGQFHPYTRGYTKFVNSEENFKTLSHLPLKNRSMKEKAFLDRHEGMKNRIRHVYRLYVAEMIEAVTYLHTNKIVHRDIKPENFLVTEDLHLKLTDIGFISPFKVPPIHHIYHHPHEITVNGSEDSNIQFRAHSRKRFCSSNVEEEVDLGDWKDNIPVYMAPELISETACHIQFRKEPWKYYPADVWSLGMTIFEMTTGLNPMNSVHWPSLLDSNEYVNHLHQLSEPDAFKMNLLSPEKMLKFIIDEDVINILQKMTIVSPLQRLSMTVLREKYVACLDIDLPNAIRKPAPWRYNQFVCPNLLGKPSY